MKQVNMHTINPMMLRKAVMVIIIPCVYVLMLVSMIYAFVCEVITDSFKSIGTNIQDFRDIIESINKQTIDMWNQK